MLVKCVVSSFTVQDLHQLEYCVLERSKTRLSLSKITDKILVTQGKFGKSLAS